MAQVQFPALIGRSRDADFSKVRFREAQTEYLKWWSLTYQSLRSLCERHPGHTSENEVAAKVWIIGRTFATQIERQVESSGGAGSSLGRVVKLLYEHRGAIDRWISEVPMGERAASFDDVIVKCVQVHARFVKLLETITYKGQSPRSFASKYLHFHRPMVPIYDSVASYALSKIVRWRKAFDCGPLGEPEDTTYRQFVLHLRQLNGLAAADGLYPTVQELDWYLLEEGDRLRREKLRLKQS